MNEEDKQYELESVATESRPADDPFPTEPFPCPACGQLLAPSCRVCVACHHAISAAEIRKPPVLPLVELPAPRELEPVHFSWRAFLIVFVISLCGETLLQRFMSPLKDQLVLGGVQILCSLWVLYDASTKHLPKPHRWAWGTLLLWIIVFPWYLARRVHPQRPCPFIEGPVKRTTLVALFILLAVLFYVIFKYAPPP